MTKLLLLEDDQMLASMIKMSLNKNRYTVDIVSCIESVTESMEKTTYDLLLFDVQIRNDKSFDLTRNIRQSSDVPIIFISAMDDELNVMSALNIGGDDYVTKPFSIGVLESRIEAVLRRSKRVEPSRIECEGLLLDLEQLKVFVHKVEKELTVTEFQLLKYMMENSGNIVSKDSLARIGWQDETFVDDNTVAVNIYRLRKKIDPLEDQQLIKTIRGLGYQFVRKCVKR